MAEAYIIRSVHQTPGEYAKNTRPRKIADIFHHITSPRNPEKATSARRTMARLLRNVMNFYRKNNRKSSVLQESAAKAIKRRSRWDIKPLIPSQRRVVGGLHERISVCASQSGRFSRVRQRIRRLPHLAVLPFCSVSSLRTVYLIYSLV